MVHRWQEGNVVGRNVYGILRAGRSASTEALVLMAPNKLASGQTNYGVALLLAMANYFPCKCAQFYWITYSYACRMDNFQRYTIWYSTVLNVHHILKAICTTWLYFIVSFHFTCFCHIQHLFVTKLMKFVRFWNLKMHGFVAFVCLEWEIKLKTLNARVVRLWQEENVSFG